MDPTASCPPDYSCTWKYEIIQNIPANHATTITAVIVIAVCVVLIAYAMALWERWH